MDKRLLSLVDGDVLELPDARGATLRVDHGSVWLTQERDRRDVLLHAGDAWTIERSGLTVAEARGDTALRVAGGAATNATVRASRKGWWARMAAWVQRECDRYAVRRFVPYL
jgi:hypothetical protein